MGAVDVGAQVVLDLGVLVAAYLLGSVHGADLVGRWHGVAPRAAGSGNPGASNVARLAGPKAGAVVLLVDGAKGAVAVACGAVLGGELLGALAGVAAVGGHVVPVGRPTQGGKGVATALGALLVLAPWVGGAVVAIWVVLAVVTRRASVASLVSVAAGPGLLLLAGFPAAVAGIWVVPVVVVVVAHRQNLAQLRSGTEPRIGRGDRLH